MGTEEGVTIHFYTSRPDLDAVFALEAKLEEAVTTANVGEFDGDEIESTVHDGVPRI